MFVDACSVEKKVIDLFDDKIAQDSKELVDPRRFNIMVFLHLNDITTFSVLQQFLGFTPGNLGHHLNKLKRAGYVDSRRVISWRVLTVLELTDEGRLALESYSKCMNKVLTQVI